MPVSHERLAWLAGVLDSDGSIGMTQNSAGSYVVQVQVTNTDHRLLDRVRGVYAGLGVKHRIGLLTNGATNVKHARALNICVGKFDQVLLLLEVVGPFMVSKFDRAALAAEFCRLRIAAMAKSRGANAVPYGPREHEIFAEMKKLQKAYKVYGGAYADG